MSKDVIADITRRAIGMKGDRVTIGVSKSNASGRFELRHRSETHDYHTVTELPVWDDESLERAVKRNEFAIERAIASGEAVRRDP